MRDIDRDTLPAADVELFESLGEEQIQSGRTLSEALDVAEARRIYLSEEWTPLFCLP